MKAELKAKTIEYVKVGKKVQIERKRTGKMYDGIVIKVLDPEELNKDGILVKIEGNYVGNTKKVVTSDAIFSVQEILEKISKHEQKKFEMKSSFKYDVNISEHLGEPTANEVLRRKIAEESASFMNTDGGIICIGVDDKKNILGVKNDCKLQSDYSQKDKSKSLDDLRLEIKQTLIDYLQDDMIIGYYFIQPYEIDGKDIFCIILDKTPEPVFVKMNVSVRIDGKDKSIDYWKSWVRVDNGIMSVNFDKFMKIWKKPQ